MWIYGKNVVFNRILSKNKIHQILITQNNIPELEEFCAQNKIDVPSKIIDIVDKNKINKLFSTHISHQNIAAKIDEINPLKEDEFVQNSKLNSSRIVLILDKITDIGNIGAIIRSAFAFNVYNIFVSKRDFPTNNAIIFKSSAGYIENVNLISYNNINNLMENLKKNDYWCVGLDIDGNNDVSDLKKYDKIALIIGSEGSGLRKLVKQNCDLLAKINTNNDLESLNVSNATAITLYAITN